MTATRADFTPEDLLGLWWGQPPRAGLPAPTDDNATLLADIVYSRYHVATEDEDAEDDAAPITHEYVVNAAYRFLVESDNKT